MNRILLIVCLVFSINGMSQKKHFVYLTDKLNTPYSITQPENFLTQRSIERRTKQGISIIERDLPVDPVYVDSLRKLGANVWYTSRWLNGVLLEADDATMTIVNNQGFVKSSNSLERKGKENLYDEEDWLQSHSKPIYNDKDGEELGYGRSKSQVRMIGADIMHEMGYAGEGMIIAVHDNGFSNVNTIPYFDKLRDEFRILGTYDFVQNNNQVYDNGGHGTSVLSTLAAFEEGDIIGTAYGASYYLFVTENTGAELPDEEVNWLVAAERADSLGVDVINTSLGYSRYDNTAYNYSYQDLNGRTSIISRASEIAANVGMLIVTSAGNEGGSSWHYITTPGDADSIITVGAVDQFMNKAGFSSFGPTPDGRVKPDLAAMGVSVTAVNAGGSLIVTDGTSFASPILCGMATGFWQAHPELTAQEVIEKLKESAHQYHQPDSLLGYGIPNFKIAHEIVSGIDLDEGVKKLTIYPNPAKKGEKVQLSVPTDDIIKKVELYNALGQKMFEQVCNRSRRNIQLKSKTTLAKGTYVIRLVTEKDVFTEKINVQ